MKILIIYDTKFGSNQKIASIMNEILSKQHDVFCYSIKEISAKNAFEFQPEALIFGGPRRLGKLKKSIQKWVEKFKKILIANNFKVSKVAAWETRIGREENKELSNFEAKFEEKNRMIWKGLLSNFNSITQPFGQLGIDIVIDEPGKMESGRLEENYAEKVKNYIEEFENI